MFSFHKPKIFRSNNGCCICKAKSSSSRFTDSKKYETEFERCFLIKDEIRTGEICNACVLLVKRCKKLPKESVKHWAHVVDARAGHKSNNKTKIQNNTSTNIVSSPSRLANKSNEEKKSERKLCKKQVCSSQIVNENESNNVMSNEEELKIVQNASNTNECDCLNCVHNRELDELEKTGSRRSKKTLTPKKFCTESTSNSSSGNSSDSNDHEELSDDEKANTDKTVVRTTSLHSTRHSTLEASLNRLQSEQSMSKASTKSKNRRKFAVKHMQRSESTFLDMNYWKREEVCCGVIFRNKTNDMVLIDSKLFTPCACRKKKILEEQQKSNEVIKCDNSIDVSMEMEIGEELVIDESTDRNNNCLSITSSNESVNDEITEKMSINLNDLNVNASVDDQLLESIVVVNSASSGISSSDSSDLSSITEEEEEDSNSSNNLISDHNVLAKNIITNRTFGVL